MFLANSSLLLLNSRGGGYMSAYHGCVTVLAAD